MIKLISVQVIIICSILSYSIFFSFIPYKDKELTLNNTTIKIIHDNIFSLIEIKKQTKPIYLIKAINIRVSQNTYIYIPYSRINIDKDGEFTKKIINMGDTLLIGTQDISFAILYKDKTATVLTNNRKFEMNSL